MIREELVKAWQSYDYLKKKEIDIPDDLQNVIDDLEERYLEQEVVPTLEKYASSLLSGFHSNCRITIEYRNDASLKCTLLRNFEDETEEEFEDITISEKEQESRVAASIKSYPKNQSTDVFWVDFEDGTRCIGADGGDTMAKAIDKILDYISIEDLASAPFTVDSMPMIMRQKVSHHGTSYQKLKNGWWVNTHMSNEAKKKRIEKLAEHVGIKLQVYLKMKKRNK